MTKKGCFLLLAFVCVIITLLALISEPAFGAVIAAVLGIILTIGGVIVKPFRERLEKFVDHNIAVPGEKCRIVLIGMGRSGKTSLLRQFITEDSPRPEESTDKFDLFEEDKRLGLENPKRYKVAIADYRGQQLSQITINHPTSFFGSPGKRLINVILFVVDLFPELRNGRNEILTTEEMVQAFSKDPKHWIDDRVDDQKRYITKYTIEQVFTLCYSKQNLQTVMLLINKVDLLESIVSLGYLQVATSETIDSYAKKLYASTVNELQKACQTNNIPEPSVYTVSAKTSKNVDTVLRQILEAYTRQGR